MLIDSFKKEKSIEFYLQLVIILMLVLQLPFDFPDPALDGLLHLDRQVSISVRVLAREHFSCQTWHHVKLTGELKKRVFWGAIEVNSPSDSNKRKSHSSHLSLEAGRYGRWFTHPDPFCLPVVALFYRVHIFIDVIGLP